MPERGHILVILDGMTDGQTGFDSLPELAALARGGLCGTSRNTPAGFPCESYPAIATLLGLGPGQIPPGGRGWLEALGAGVPVQPGDLLLRGSWVRLEQGRAAGYADPPQSLPAVPGVEDYALGGALQKSMIRLACTYLAFIEEKPLHPVGSHFDGQFLEQQFDQYYCPQKAKELGNPDALCHFCSAQCKKTLETGARAAAKNCTGV